jgi:hypothetical protein
VATMSASGVGATMMLGSEIFVQYHIFKNAMFALITG